MNELEQLLRREFVREAAHAPRWAPGNTATTTGEGRSNRRNDSRGRGRPLLAAAAVAGILGLGALATQRPIHETPNTAPPQVTSAASDAYRSSAPSPSKLDLDKVLTGLNWLANRPGYSGVSVSAVDGALEIKWSGTIPERVARLDGTTKRGAKITVTSVYYSLEYLDDAGHVLAMRAESAGIHLAGTSPSPERDGLEILVNRNESVLDIRTEDDVLEVLRPITPVPIVSVSFGGGVGTWLAPQPKD